MWNLLEGAEPSDVDGILSAEEIDAWKKRTLHWFDSGESQHKNPIKYISIEDINKFAQTTGKEIRAILAGEGLI